MARSGLGSGLGFGVVGDVDGEGRGSGLGGPLRVAYALQKSAATKMRVMAVGLMSPAMNAPKSAPRTVATSRKMPMRMLVKPSRTYAAAAPELVAMTATREVPTAYLMSIPKARTRSGMMMTPPPRPVSAPRKPAATEARARRKMKRSGGMGGSVRKGRGEHNGCAGGVGERGGPVRAEERDFGGGLSTMGGDAIGLFGWAVRPTPCPDRDCVAVN